SKFRLVVFNLEPGTWNLELWLRRTWNSGTWNSDYPRGTRHEHDDDPGTPAGRTARVDEPVLLRGRGDPDALVCGARPGPGRAAGCRPADGHPGDLRPRGRGAPGRAATRLRSVRPTQTPGSPRRVR